MQVFESFFRTPTGWLVVNGIRGDCEDEQNDCGPPQTRAAGGVTILTAPDISYRMYNAWGYAGMADRAEYLIVRGDEYAHCDDRLFDSPLRIQPPDRPRR